MRSKIQLVNIYLRRNCSNAKNGTDIELSKRFLKKIVRVKKCKNWEITSPNLTSKFKPSRFIRKIKYLKPGPKIVSDDFKYNAKKNNSKFNYSDKVENAKTKEPVPILNDVPRSFKMNDFVSYGRFSKWNMQADIIEKSGKLNHSKDPTSCNEQSVDDSIKNGNMRINKLNMQMLSKKLYEQLFGNVSEQTGPTDEQLKALKHDLNKFGIKTDDYSCLPDIDIELPPLEGHNLEEHFYNVANTQNKSYLKIINQIMENIPEIPKQWLFQEGWTRYTDKGAERVDYPLEDGVVFDVEVCMNEGPLPTLATAVSTKAWYGWVSKFVLAGSAMPVESRSYTTEMLIPMESTPNDRGKKLNSIQKKPKIIIGHNVSYDRARIKEQYWLNLTGTRFIDTMSLHMSVSGINSFQRAILKSNNSKLEGELWRNCTSLNSLVEVYKLYCGQKIDKKSRDVFLEGTLMDVRKQFNELMTYCATDVVATHSVLRNLFPMFQERFPHPVTLAGMLELGSAYLPINSNWQRYLQEAESTYEDLNYEAKYILGRRADEVCKLMHNEKYKEDLWMWDQDWSTQNIKIKTSLTKAKLMEIEKKKAEEKKEPSDFERYLTDGEDEDNSLEQKFAYLNDTKYLLPVKMPHMPGYPAWYRKLCLKKNVENWTPGPQNISTSMQIAPKLLNLTWENYPLHYIREYGWGFLVPYSNNVDSETKLPMQQLLAQCPLSNVGSTKNEVDYALGTLNKDVQNNLHKVEFWKYKRKTNPNIENVYKGSGIWCNVDLDNCCWFFKLPHKDGVSHKVGNPLAKDFLHKFSENVLAGLDSSATQVLKIARMVSYWRNNRNRILSQMIIWLDEKDLPYAPRKSRNQIRYGAIVPQVVVSGTLTRRAVEPTWMTASNAHDERVGSELRSMIQAPPGYNIIGADVDSQELWIASIIGDAYYAKIHGATPVGWMTLIGSKANGSDMHSMTAKAVGISRDHAKVINYARIYGAGQKFAERLLKQFNPSMTDIEAISKSRKMFTLTKGKRVYRLKPEYVNQDFEDKSYSTYDVYKIAKVHGKTVDEMFEKGRWVGGSESAMFNRLEEIAGSLSPVTPFLNSRLSRALENGSGTEDNYLPTKVNWIVQSGAVDFLHLMLVSMRWLMRENARFCLSFHDEIRYLVPSRFKYNAALALHVTNLITRSFCSSRLGIYDLPMSVAFFASVEIDTVLRKESSDDCKTPSNPHGLQVEYEVPTGESLNVQQALEKSGGSLGSWHKPKSKETVDAVDESVS